MHSSGSIDLGKKQSTMSDDIIKWALSFGRLLIIVVEIVAFSAFLYRFVLDRELVDLNDKIKGEQAIVLSLDEREAEFRNLHERLSTVKTINTTGNSKLKIFNDIIAFTPTEITYSAFVINNEKLLLEINISSIPAFTKYKDSLQEYNQINSVTVTGIDNSAGTNTVKVTIEAKLKGEQNETI